MPSSEGALGRPCRAATRWAGDAPCLLRRAARRAGDRPSPDRRRGHRPRMGASDRRTAVAAGPAGVAVEAQLRGGEGGRRLHRGVLVGQAVADLKGVAQGVGAADGPEQAGGISGRPPGRLDGPVGVGPGRRPGPGIGGHGEKHRIAQLAAGRVGVLRQLAEVGDVPRVLGVADVIPPRLEQLPRGCVLMPDRRQYAGRGPVATAQAAQRPDAERGSFPVGASDPFQETGRLVGESAPGDQDVDHRIPVRRVEPGQVELDGRGVLQVDLVADHVDQQPGGLVRVGPPEGFAQRPLDLRGLLPCQRLVVGPAGVGPGAPPVPLVVSLAVVEPAERSEGQRAVGRVGALEPGDQAVDGLRAEHRLQGPGRAGGEPRRRGIDRRQARVDRVQPRPGPWRRRRRDGRATRRPVDQRGPTRLRSSRPRPTTARSRTRGSASVNASMNGAAGIRAASSLRSDRASRANSRNLPRRPRASPGPGSTQDPAACSSVKIAATWGQAGPRPRPGRAYRANAGLRLPQSRRIARCAARRRTCPGAARHSMSCASVAARRSGRGPPRPGRSRGIT